jgi:RNA polymerase sigma-70 factor (ECF subfamily)
VNEGRISRRLSEASDDELFTRLRASADAASAPSRSDAFDQLFERFHGKIYRWCLKILDDPTKAEDVTQGVFLELWRGKKPYSSHQRFGAWLYVITRNRCLNELRTERRRPDGELDEDLLRTLAARSDPHGESEQLDLDAKVREVCRERLNETEQQVIYLRYTWGLKVNEITSTLGLSNASGARTHLRSAEEKLRRYLKRLHREIDEG